MVLDLVGPEIWYVGVSKPKKLIPLPTQKSFGHKFFFWQIFLTKSFLDKNYFQTKKFSRPKDFFPTKYFLGHNVFFNLKCSFRSKMLFEPTFFLTKHFLVSPEEMLHGHICLWESFTHYTVIFGQNFVIFCPLVPVVPDKI